MFPSSQVLAAGEDAVLQTHVPTLECDLGDLGLPGVWVLAGVWEGQRRSQLPGGADMAAPSCCEALSQGLVF